MNPAIFREYDIRGVAEKDFDQDFGHMLGRAFATLARERGKRRVAVGRDCRLTSLGYATAVKTGVRQAGLDVVDIGVSPTPLFYFSLFHYDLDGGIQITGSHNPPEYNGFKICVGKETIFGPEIQKLRHMIEAGKFHSGQGKEEAREIVLPYQEFLQHQFGRMPRSIAVVVDAGNGTAGPVAPPIFRALGCRVTELFCEMDGRFPHHHPDPTVTENMTSLRERVTAEGAELGIAYDGDADRIGVVDKSGRIIWGDELLIVLARDVLEHQPGAVIISEVKCSQRLFDEITARGGRAIMWKAGHSLLKAKMRETGAALGGEMSGHLFFADRYFGYDDAIYASCRLLEILARKGKDIAELLADVPPAYTTPEIRVECPDHVKFLVVERARERFRHRYDIIDIDGVRVQFPQGWGLLRASNTQPVLVMRFEASSSEKLAEYRRIVETALEEIRRELQA